MSAPLEPVIQALGPVPNSQVINKFVAFVNQKNKQPPCIPATVVDDFCDVLVKILKIKPTKKITPQKIMVLVKEMNDAAETDGGGSSQREWIINKILDLFGGQKLDPLEVPKTRNWFTPSGRSLTTATMEATTKAGGVYNSRTYNDKKSKPATWTYPHEYQQQINHSSNFVTGIITYIERKECAICWMCGNPIYVYKYTVNGTEYFFSCGQDEHVLPPGWGNILGILWSDLNDQRKYNSCPRSLSPSHAWCNQLKNDELLLLLPRFIQNIFTSFQINDAGFDRFKTKGEKWLTKGNNIIDHNMFYRNLTSPPNVTLLNKPKAVLFMHSMEQRMRLHLVNLIGELQNNIVTPAKAGGNITTTHYTEFILRTILCLAYIWNKIMKNRSNKKGGKGTKRTNTGELLPEKEDADDDDADDDDADDNGYYGSNIGDKDKLMPHLYVAGLFDKNKEFDEYNIFNDNNTFYQGDTISNDEYETKEDMTPWQVYIKNILSTGQKKFNESFMVNAFGIGNIIFKVYKPQSSVIPSINLTKMSSAAVMVHATQDQHMVPELLKTASGMPPAPQSGQFVPQFGQPFGQPFGMPPAPQSGQFVPQFGQPPAPQSGQFVPQFGQPFGMPPTAPSKSLEFDMPRAPPTWLFDKPNKEAMVVEPEFGGKHKSQKYKSRKYKSQKYKTRKHKSQKQKNRKKHKSRKHKSRKHK